MTNGPSDGIKQQVLISEVACGDADLAAFLWRQIGPLWCLSGEQCDSTLQFINTKVALLQEALMFSRKQIDLANTRANSSGEDRFDSTNVRDAESQRTAQGTRCAWSFATNFQQFSRDSGEHDRAKSVSNAEASGWMFNNGFDRSTQRSSGQANAHSTSTSSTNGDGSGFSHYNSVRGSRSFAGTGPLQHGDPVPTGQIKFSNASPYFSISPGSDINNRGVADAPCYPDDPDAACPPLPSYGRGYHNRYNLSVGIPAIGVLRVDWGTGENFRQSFVCSSGLTRINGSQSSHLGYSQTDASATNASSASHDESHNQHDVHRAGASHRESQSRLDAQSTGAMDSQGESHTGSDRKAWSEAQGTGQGTARSSHHSAGHGTGIADSVNVGQVRKWGQIFDNLQKMSLRAIDELNNAQQVLAAMSGAKVGKICASAVPMACNPRANQFLKQVNRPCNPCTPALGQLGEPTWGGSMRKIRGGG